jgi:hypothetical protein
MSDTAIIEAMQTIIRATQLDGENAFQHDSVYIDDWQYRDKEIVFDPFCRLDSPTLIGSRHDDSLTEETNFWQVRATIYKSFDDWPITRPLLRKLRTAVIDQFNASNNRNLGALAATADVFITDMRDEIPDTFLYVYDRYVKPEEFEEVIPIGMEIPVLFEITERC